jgi:hypothetical protein
MSCKSATGAFHHEILIITEDFPRVGKPFTTRGFARSGISHQDDSPIIFAHESGMEGDCSVFERLRIDGV